MISNNRTDDSQQQIGRKTKGEESPRSTHSTDTEPEAEIFSNRQQTTEFLDSNQESTEEKEAQTHSKWKKRNGFTRLAEKIPSYEYEVPKNAQNHKNQQIESQLVALDAFDTNNNRFSDYFEAFLYVGQHCLKYHNRFTRENCRQYLKKCYIIDFAHDEFIPIMTHLSSRKFYNYFQNAQKELKYM